MGRSKSGYPPPAMRHGTGALVLLCVAQFIDVMDFSIVNVALPTIQKDLGASTETLQWVISGYALTYGGFLLLGARAADRFGRRRLFVLGLGLFTAASLFGGAAQSEAMLIVGRLLQGVGAAIVSPAALSLITTIFTRDEDRNRALSALAAVGSAAVAGGVILGGLLTEALSWRWVLFVNGPIGVVAILLAPRVLPEARDPSAPRLDLPGSVAATSGLVAVLLALTQSETVGWTSPQVLVPLAMAAVLLLAFVAIERRTPDALVPPRLFRSRSLATANAVMFLASAAFYPMFVATSQYLQRVLAYSPWRAGLAFVPMAIAVALFSGFVSARATGRFGARRVLPIAMTVMTVGLVLLARAPANGTFVTDVLPGTLIVAIGIGTSFTAILDRATAGVPERDQGVAAGLIVSSQQIGGAVGVALLLAIANARSDAAAGSTADRLVAGYSTAFLAAAVLTLAAAFVAYVALPTGPMTYEPE